MLSLCNAQCEKLIYWKLVIIETTIIINDMQVPIVGALIKSVAEISNIPAETKKRHTNLVRAQQRLDFVHAHAAQAANAQGQSPDELQGLGIALALAEHRRGFEGEILLRAHLHGPREQLAGRLRVAVLIHEHGQTAQRPGIRKEW